jgi:hypothetical protein
LSFSPDTSHGRIVLAGLVVSGGMLVEGLRRFVVVVVVVGGATLATEFWDVDGARGWDLFEEVALRVTEVGRFGAGPGTVAEALLRVLVRGAMPARLKSNKEGMCACDELFFGWGRVK